MLNGALARRYAQALFQLAVELKALEQVNQELRGLNELVQTNQDLKVLLNHPNIKIQDKKEILAKVLDQKVSDLTKHFLYLLLDRRRQNMLPMIQRDFARLANEAQNIVVAKITSATTLSPSQETKLIQAIEKCTGKKAELIAEVDPTLIGGVKLQIGDRVMDGTLLTAFNKMREELKKTSDKPQQEIGVNK